MILIVVAILSLAVWWARDLRHGRRARQLVPPAEEESESDSDATSADPHAGANPDDGDNDSNGRSPDGLTNEERFFAKPAPELLAGRGAAVVTGCDHRRQERGTESSALLLAADDRCRSDRIRLDAVFV